MQKQKNSQGSCMESMGAAGHGLYRHLWAIHAHCPLPLLLVFVVCVNARHPPQGPTPGTEANNNQPTC